MLKGIDYLIAKGLVDGDRLGTMGWSNGGILSIALLVWTNRFKVGGIGAADVDWISDYGTCAFGVSFDNYYLLGAPWEKPDYYQQMSPLFYFKDMKTPTIISTGQKIPACPLVRVWSITGSFSNLVRRQSDLSFSPLNLMA